MLLVEESIIPSALVTKENLMSSLMKTQKKQNRPLPQKGQIGRNSRLDVCGENTRRVSVNHERATPFLPPLVYATPRTRGGTPWKRIDTGGRRTAYSVLSLRDEVQRSRNNQSRRQAIESLQKSVIPQAQTALPRQRYRQTLKFWKGSKQHSRKGKRRWNKANKKKELTSTKEKQTKSMENENTDETLGWSKNFAYLEEIDNTENGFYARQLALRERLIEFEAMHYKEAVTRINRYREKLRRPLLSRSKGMTQKPNDRRKAATEIESLQVEGGHEISNAEKETSASDQMFRMSPDKEWKPNVQQKMIFNGKPKRLQQSGFPPGKKRDGENQDGKSRRNNQLKSTMKTENSRAVPSSEQTMKTESSNNQTQNDSMALKDNLGITAVGLAQPRQNKPSADQNPDRKSKVMEEGQSSGLANQNQMYEDRPNTKSNLSTKLRLLLSKSAQKENEEPGNGQEKQNSVMHKKKRHSYFRNSVSRYQLSNNDRFPSITRIGSLTTAKGQDGEQKFVMQGISDESTRARLSTSLSNRIMERMKSRAGNDNHQLTEIRPKTQNPNQLHDKQFLEHSEGNRKILTLPFPQAAAETTINGVAIAGVNTQQTAQRTEFSQSKAASSEVIKKSRSLQRAMKSHRKALKQQKVLKVAFVESINMAERRQNAYQELKEKEMAAKQMPVDPKQLAITSLTAAILNSEVLLRAPSSSPVDFLKGHHAIHPKSKSKATSTDAQKSGDYLMDSNHTMQEKHNNTLVNPTDGLSPINKPLEFLRSNQTDTFLPSVSDLVDLNGLYDAMKLHRHQGIKASTLGSLQILQRQHLDRILLKKQPFYYNPFHNQRSHATATDPSVPLYVVTAAKAVHKPDEKRLHSSHQSQKQMERDGFVEKKVFHNSPFPEYGKGHGARGANAFNDYETVGYSGIRGVTVSTSAQPIRVATDKGK